MAKLLGVKISWNETFLLLLWGSKDRNVFKNISHLQQKDGNDSESRSSNSQGQRAKQTNKQTLLPAKTCSCLQKEQRKKRDKRTYRDRETLTAGEALTQRNRSRVSKKRTDRKQVNKQPGCWEKRKSEETKQTSRKTADLSGWQRRDGWGDKSFSDGKTKWTTPKENRVPLPDKKPINQRVILKYLNHRWWHFLPMNIFCTM